jgi:hypothetical protein
MVREIVLQVDEDDYEAIMAAVEMRQGAKFYGKIGTDEALLPGEGNLIGRTLGEIGRGWVGNYDPDYFKDCPPLPCGPGYPRQLPSPPDGRENRQPLE